MSLKLAAQKPSYETLERTLLHNGILIEKWAVKGEDLTHPFKMNQKCLHVVLWRMNRASKKPLVIEYKGC